MEKILVGLVEDQLLFRKGIKSIINSWQDIEVVFESEDGYSVIEKLRAVNTLPHVMLVDLSLPLVGGKEFGGRELTTALQENFPDVKILILSVNQDENFIVQLIRLGAHGYLVKDCDPEEVREAILSTFHKGAYVNQRALRALQKKSEKTLPPQNLKEQLTRREIEILNLICEQHTSEEIAEKLFLSTKTVNGHRNNLLEKTGAKNTAGLVIYAVKNYIVKV